MANRDPPKHLSDRGPLTIAPQDISNAIRGVEFPATKDRLLDKARANDAPARVLTALDRLPDDKYNDPREIADQFHQIAERD